MRKFTLLLAMVAFASFSFAQGNFKPAKASLSKAEPVKKVVQTSVQEKAPGDVLWSHDFNGEMWAATSDNGTPVPSNVPAGWDLVDETGQGFYWRWDTVGPRGNFTSPSGEGDDCHTPQVALESETADNGWIMLESNYYNTPGDCAAILENDIDAAVVYTDGLDFSTALGVKLRLTQWNRFCCGYADDANAWFEASIDGGTTWAQKIVSEEPVNDGVDNDGEVSEFDITALVAGHADVQFRFRQAGLTHYHWEIDDVKFVESMEHDIALMDYWNDYIELDTEPLGEDAESNFREGFYYYPWFMIQSFYGYATEFINNGSVTQTNVTQNIEITRNGEITETFVNSPMASFTPGMIDTVKVEGEFFPNRKGKYVISHFMTADDEDDTPSNDMLSRTVVVGDNMLSPVNYKLRVGSLSPDNWVSYEAGSGMGFFFTIPEPALHGDGTGDYFEVNGIEVWVPTQREEQETALFENEEASFVAELYKYDEESDTYSFVIGSSERILTVADTSNYVYVPFEKDFASEYIIEGGDYLVNLAFNGNWTDDYDRIQSFNIGRNETQKRGFRSAIVVKPGATGTATAMQWVNAGPCLALDISFSDPYPYVEQDVTFIVTDDDRAPVESARIQVAQHDVRTDATGQVVVTLEDGAYPYIVTVGYGDDAVTVESSSFDVTGEPLVIDVTSSIQNVFAEFNIYPNPSNGVFTVNIEGQANITVVNLAGQVVDTRTINGTQTINLDVESGMYFVSVKIGDSVATKQLIVR